MADITLNEVVVSAKKPIKTVPVPNPLHNYASYTYSVSLWWLSVVDYNKLMDQTDVDAALSWEPGSDSYVIAEDGGIYPDRRLPNSPGLNYNIQEIKFNTTISPNKSSRSSNMLDGSMTIVEPYGVTFIDQLVAASYDGKKYNNYTQQPMMLQIDFKGYDDDGEPIPSTQMSIFRKRFPIRLRSVKVNVTSKGAEYKIDFCAAGNSAHYPGNYNTTPKNFTVTADTVGKFFKELSRQYFSYFANQVLLGQAEWVEGLDFDIDPTIAASSIVNDKELPINKASTKGKVINLKESTFTIPRGTPIVDVINKVMAHSDFLIKLQLGLEGSSSKSDFDVFNAFKTVVKVKYEGFDLGGEGSVTGILDGINNRYPMQITYGIHQYPTWINNHKNLPKYSDSSAYTSKVYDYYYTGKNVDVLDFKLDFDTTYYTAIQAYTSAIAATESTQTTLEDEYINDPTNKSIDRNIKLNPAIITGGVPNISPMVYRPIVNDPNTSIGMNMSSRPAAQIASDVMKSIYTTLNGDMLSLELTIVGDPTLLKQDDWLYIPSPNTSKKYNSWDSQSQAEFSLLYGHVRMDSGDVIVEVNVNSPIDIDTETINQGLVTPLPGYSKSLFSGQYRILTISSRFYQGKFEQVLSLARYINSDVAKVFAVQTNGQLERSDPVSTSKTNQTQLVPTNTQTNVPGSTPTDGNQARQ